MKLNAGVIGLGVGEAHCEGFRSHPRCRVAALCDFSDEKLKRAAKKYPNARLAKNADDLFEDPAIDVVSIASFDNFHYGQIAKALKNGKHVFVEKPLCLKEDELRRIRDLLRAHPGLRLSSNLILRKSPRFRLVRRWVRAGRFGRLYYLEGDYNYGRIEKITNGWRGKIDFYSVVYGGGVHLVDLLHWITGDTVTEVSSFGNRIASNGSRFRFNDCVASLLRFKSGIVAKVTSNFGCVFPHFHALALYGTKGTFLNGLERGLFYRSRDSATPPVPVTAAYPGVHKGGLIYDFLESILKNRAPEVNEEDVFKAMAVCFAMEKAAKTSKVTRVRYI